jgi:hypothetical protein
LLSYVYRFGPDWKKIASMLSLKNGKEAIFEFLKIKTPDLFTKVSKYLNQPEQAAASQPNPYSQMD